jgi:hypothetical protein
VTVVPPAEWQDRSREDRPGTAAVIARCLDQVAQAVEQISAIAWDINRRNRGR